MAAYVTACTGSEQSAGGADAAYQLAEAIRETCAWSDECYDPTEGKAPEHLTDAELQACAVARLTRAHWAECIEPVQAYYDCTLAQIRDCESWEASWTGDACNDIEQEAYAQCPKLSHLPL